MKTLKDEAFEEIRTVLEEDVKRSWEVKVRTKDNLKVAWNDIDKEDTSPYYSLRDIASKCYKLLEKYPDISAIQICDADTHWQKYVYERDTK